MWPASMLELTYLRLVPASVRGCPILAQGSDFTFKPLSRFFPCAKFQQVGFFSIHVLYFLQVAFQKIWREVGHSVYNSMFRSVLPNNCLLIIRHSQVWFTFSRHFKSLGWPGSLMEENSTTLQNGPFSLGSIVGTSSAIQHDSTTRYTTSC